MRRQEWNWIERERRHHLHLSFFPLIWVRLIWLVTLFGSCRERTWMAVILAAASRDCISTGKTWQMNWTTPLTNPETGLYDSHQGIWKPANPCEHWPEKTPKEIYEREKNNVSKVHTSLLVGPFHKNKKSNYYFCSTRLPFSLEAERSCVNHMENKGEGLVSLCIFRWHSINCTGELLSSPKLHIVLGY